MPDISFWTPMPCSTCATKTALGMTRCGASRRALSHEGVELHASISSFKDLYYILSRLYKDEGRARLAVERMMGSLVAPVDLLASYGPAALSCDAPDFEDGLIRVSAEREGADVLLTRDTKAFVGSSVAHMSAQQFEENFT